MKYVFRSSQHRIGASCKIVDRVFVMPPAELSMSSRRSQAGTICP